MFKDDLDDWSFSTSSLLQVYFHSFRGDSKVVKITNMKIAFHADPKSMLQLNADPKSAPQSMRSASQPLGSMTLFQAIQANIDLDWSLAIYAEKRNTHCIC